MIIKITPKAIIVYRSSIILLCFHTNGGKKGAKLFIKTANLSGVESSSDSDRVCFFLECI